MPDDNAKAKAVAVMSHANYAGDAGTFARIVAAIEVLIRSERDAVITANMDLREAWHDSPDAQAFSVEMSRRLLTMWAD